MKPVFITKDEAREAVHDQVPDAPIEDGRTIIHCFSGGLGADWDKVDVLAAIEEAEAVAWVDSIFDHDLYVSNGRGDVKTFAISRPPLLLLEEKRWI